MSPAAPTRSPDDGPAARILAAAAAVLLLGLFVLESARGARLDAAVSDEAVNLASGYAFLRTGRVLLDPERPMLGKAVLAASLLPLRPALDRDSDAWRHRVEWVAAHEFLWENRVPGRRLLLAGRVPAIVCAAALLALLATATARLYGRSAGLVALVLGATCPDLLGHSHLATLDLPFALVATLALAAFLGFAQRPGRLRQLLLALALFAAFATSFAAWRLVAALAAAAVVRAALDPGLARRGTVRPPGALAGRAAALYVLLGGLALAGAYAALGVAATYARSPEALAVGLGGNLDRMLAGYPSFLAGTVARDGFPGYYFQALAAKLPVLTLALFAASLASWPALRLGRARTEAPALTFVLATLVIAGFDPWQTGVRRVFAVYPVVFAFAARLLAAPPGSGGLPPALKVGLAAVIAGSSLVTAAAARPLYLSYLNELVAPPGPASPLLLDSNLDWGQDLGRLGSWLRDRGDPAARLAVFSAAPLATYGIGGYQALPAAGPVLPPPGTLIGAGEPDLACLSANNLHGLFLPQDLYAWLRRREPMARIGGSIWCYDLAGDAALHRQLAEVYRRAGWWRFAAHETQLAAIASSRSDRESR